MSRFAWPAAAGLALASLLLGADLAGADPADSMAPQVAQPATRRDTAPDQISNPAAAEHGATGVTQLTAPSGHPTAPPQIARPAAGRITQVQSIVGHDRCDPASPGGVSPDCAHIPENHAEDFETASPDATPQTVDPNAPSQDLVNGILSGGTGTVVQLPPK